MKSYKFKIENLKPKRWNKKSCETKMKKSNGAKNLMASGNKKQRHEIHSSD